MMIIRYNIDLFFCFLHIRVITISTFGDESSNFTDETNKLRQSKKEIPFISILLLSLFVVAAQCSNGMKVRRQDICFTFLPRGFHPMYVVYCYVVLQYLYMQKQRGCCIHPLLQNLLCRSMKKLNIMRQICSLRSGAKIPKYFCI